MSSELRTDVAILGGGCAGLWLSYELAKYDIGSVVLDQQRFAAFASTRNQGWLQSGALYAMRPDGIEAAIGCMQGKALIENDFGMALGPAVPSYFYFDQDESPEELLELCQHYGFDPALRLVDPKSLVDDIPILRNSAASTLIQVPDRTVNTRLVLSHLASRAGQSGVAFQEVAQLLNFRVHQTNEEWTVEFPELTVSAKLVVLACGVKIPELLKYPFNLEWPDGQLRATRISVLSIREPLAECIIASPTTDYAPSIAPYSIEGTQGITVALNRNDTPLLDVHLNDNRRFEVMDQSAHLLARYLGIWFPELIDWVRRESHVDVHIYECTKLERTRENVAGSSDRGSISHIFSSGIAAFYAGKFTAAPIYARKLAEQVSTYLSEREMVGLQHIRT